MVLEAGSKLGPYEILAPLGAGGMGEVYRARDTKLGREVALKALPEAFARDPERLARFEREAHALAALNHPRIAAIHGFEEQDGIRFLILELVPGTTLAERLLRGPLPMREAVALCAQIAEALAAAHEEGLIHRDLKPSNVNVTPEGHAKLLDFGLARFCAPRSTGPLADESPTLTTPTRSEGVIHGTAAYMSPEQARGEELDRRSDIWSFGCVLFETLSGRRAFPGKTVSETIAAVLEHDPDCALLPTKTPKSVRALVRRCLCKDRARRLHDAADAQLELEEALGEPHSPAARVAIRGPSARPLFLGVVGVALAFLAGWLLRPSHTGAESGALAARAGHRLDVALPEGARLPGGGFGPSVLALSRDGMSLAFVAGGALYVRRLDELEARVVFRAPHPGPLLFNPFFSPDGEWLGFASGDKLKVIRSDGGALRTLCDAPSLRGADWTEEDRILFAFGSGQLAWVSAGGGEPEVVASPDPERGFSHLRWPQVLPDGVHALVTALGAGLRQKDWRAVLVSLKTGEIRPLLDAPAAAARYLPSGHLVFLEGGTGRELSAVLASVRFNPSSLQTRGPTVTVLGGVHVGGSSAAPYYGISDAGVLVYAPYETSPPEREFVWLDRHGTVEPASARKAYYRRPRLSPDGTRVATSIGDSFEAEPPRRLFDLPEGAVTGWHSWDIAPDGRFLMILTDPKESEPLRLVVVPNWIHELRARLGEE